MRKDIIRYSFEGNKKSPHLELMPWEAEWMGAIMDTKNPNSLSFRLKDTGLHQIWQWNVK